MEIVILWLIFSVVRLHGGIYGERLFVGFARTCIEELRCGHMRSEDVAQKCSVSASGVYDLRKRPQETGNTAPQEYKCGAKLKRWTKGHFKQLLYSNSLTATMVVDGAMNGELFLAYVRQILLPTLKERDIVVMNNLSSHKVMGVKVAIESMGAKVLYLTPCRPDLNPIENVFSKLKTLVRKSKRRKVDDLWRKLGELSDVFASEKCRNDFKKRRIQKNNTVQ